MSIERKERLKREGDLDESGGERRPHALRARRVSNILEKVSSSSFGRVCGGEAGEGGQVERISGSGFEVDRRGGSPGMSHIAGDKYRARESRPKIPASCGKGRTGSWKSFHCGRTMQSNGLFLPLSNSLSARVCVLYAGLPKLGCCPTTKTRCPCTVTETNTDCGSRVKRDRCIGVLFLRYRGFQGYESAHRSRDRVNGAFSIHPVPMLRS